MSLIVAIKDNDKFYIGCDTRVSCGSYYVDSYHLNPKAYFVDAEKGLILGYSGLSVIGDYAATILKSHNIDKLDRNYIVERFWPEFYKRCYTLTGTDKSNFVDGELIIIMKDVGFHIDGSGSVMNILETCTVGSGCEVADGIMSALYDYKPLNPEAMIIATIKHTASVISNISSEVYIASSTSKKFIKSILTIK